MADRYIHAKDPLESLIVPDDCNLNFFKIENWDFQKLVPDKHTKGYMKLEAKCKIMGFEKCVYEWIASDKDIELYGFGDEDLWRAYVIQSFNNTLIAKGNSIRKKLAKKAGLALAPMKSPYHGKI